MNMRTFIIASLGLVVASGTAFARDYGDIDKINGGISVAANSTAGSLETVNGGVKVGDGSRVRSIETVNGGIRIGANVEVGSVETVNGGIRIARRTKVGGDVEAVNGGLSLEPGVHVRGGVENVNGGIRAVGAVIERDLRTSNGGITLDIGTRVGGGIHVRARSGWANLIQFGENKPPRVVIGRYCVVRGALNFEREVELYVHSTARIGKVTGATAISYSGAEPPPR